MPTWSGIAQEIEQLRISNPGVNPFDIVRRKYLAALQAHTGNSTILYATKWTQADQHTDRTMLQVVPEDMQGLMEVMHSLQSDNLDLVLHSPGGSAEAAESLMTYLRSKFPGKIRVIVPHAAMSAATMMACAADEIVMGKHSFLGPIDPQMLIQSAQGTTLAPAQAIVDQFDLAKQDCSADASRIRVWMPMLQQYGPALLVQCKNLSDLAESLVSGWLMQYMFASDPNKQTKSENIAKWLASHSNFKTHNRFISRDSLIQQGLLVTSLESDQQLQDLVLSLFHATTITFDGTPAVKIIENHLGRAFIKQQLQMRIPIQAMMQPPQPTIAPQPVQAPPVPPQAQPVAPVQQPQPQVPAAPANPTP